MLYPQHCPKSALKALGKVDGALLRYLGPLIEEGKSLAKDFLQKLSIINVGEWVTVYGRRSSFDRVVNLQSVMQKVLEEARQRILSAGRDIDALATITSTNEFMTEKMTSAISNMQTAWDERAPRPLDKEIDEQYTIVRARLNSAIPSSEDVKGVLAMVLNFEGWRKAHGNLRFGGLSSAQGLCGRMMARLIRLPLR